MRPRPSPRTNPSLLSTQDLDPDEMTLYPTTSKLMIYSSVRNMLPTWWRELTWLWKKGYNWSFTRFLRIWNQCQWSFSLTISPKTSRILKFGRVINLFREVSVYHGISTLMSSPSRYLLTRSHLLEWKFCLQSTAYLTPPPLGFASPVTVQGKILFWHMLQTSSGTDWDSPFDDFIRF